jgi:lipopolysaccharide export system permease protein
MIKKLDRYLLGHFLVALAVVTVSIGLIIVVINMVEQLRDFIDNKVPALTVLEYYGLFAGWTVKAFTPMFVMLATLFSFSVLSKRLEILAMKASGRSLWRIALPIWIVTLLICAGHFYYNEFIFPPANKKRVEIKEFVIERRSRQTFTSVNNVYRQISPGNFYTASKFSVERQEGIDFKLYKTRNNDLMQMVLAEKLLYRDYRWRAIDGIVRNFNDTAEQSFFRFDTLALPEIKDEPADLARRLGKPEDMGLRELERYINLMKRTGGPYLREMIDLKIKYAFPLTSFIVTLVCIPFAANPRKGGIAVSFAVGALIALAYFVLFRILQSAGANEKLPQEIAVWGVNGLFFLVGLVVMFSARK